MININKGKFLRLLTGLCVLTVLLYTYTSIAFAGEQISENNQHIFDNAGILSTDEVETLEKDSITYGEDAGIDMIVLTHDDASAKDGEEYIEDFYDSHSYKDCVILLIDMANRDVVLEGHGTAETYIHSKRGDVIISNIKPDLSSGNYVAAIQSFFKYSLSYMKDDSELNYNHNYDNQTSGNSDYNSDYGNSTNRTYDTSSVNTVDNILRNIWVQILASLIIGGIVVGTMAYNSSGRMSVSGNNYIDAGDSGLIGRRDDYIRTTVTRVRKPTQNNNNSGGFTGGISSGGSSHSTSRGSF